MRYHPIHSSRFSWLLLIVATELFLSHHPTLAEDFDWRNVNGQNWLTPVRSQFGGTCWDFAACGVLEAKYMLTRNDNIYQPDVSEQQVCWEGYMGDSTNGGHAYEALDYFTSHGVVLESECPNDPNDPAHWDDPAPDDPWPLAAGWENRVFKSTSNVNTISEGTNINYVKDCLKKYGPLEIYMRADDDFYIPNPGSYRGGHRVVIVGFHDDAGVPGGGYWIIKNSWGSGWNSGGPGTINHGYGAVAYANQPSYEDPFWPWDHNYDVGGINGAVYFTGPMATVTWKGGSGTWVSGGNNWTGSDMYGNALPTYAWENKETTAIFNASSGTNISLSGKVIAHGLMISSGATGYVFNGVNNPSLTLTGGGITAHETVTINAPVTIGAPQTWTVDSGKCLTIGGNLHTIISGLTITGVADIVVTGSIDGGGVLNSMGVAPGKITLKNGAYLWLNGAASYSVDIDAQSSSHGISFSQPAGVVGHCYGTISGGGWIDKRDRGTIVLHAANTYTNWTSIYDGGAVQADSGVGLPSASLLNLNGGVLQSNGTVTFTRSLGTSGSNKFQWNTAGGGFAGGAGPMTVNIGGSGDIVQWGTTVGSQIVGPLKFGSTTAANTVTFVNNIDLDAAERTFYVEDNPNTDDDLAIISGVITDVQGFTTDVWSGAILKTGPGTLVLTGENENGQGDGSRGNTTIADGVLQADRYAGLSDWAGLILNGGVLQSNSEVTYAEPLWANGSGALRVKWASGGFSAGGGKMTVNIGGSGATVNFGDADGTHGIAGTLKLSSNTAHYETELQNGLNLNGGARTIQVDDNPSDSGDFATLSGVISGSGSLMKTGSGTLYLRGAGNTYAGATTVTDGTVWLDKSSGTAIPGNLSIAGTGSNVYVRLNRDEQIANSSVLSFSNSANYARFYLEGHTETVAGISCSDGRGIIQDGALIVNSSNNYSYNGYLRYSASFEKWGSGTQTLSGGHISYTGGTTVSSGKLVLQDTTHSSFLPTSITNNATLEFDTATTDVNFSGPISGSGALSKIGSYTLTLSGNNSYSGNTTISAGTLVLDSSAGYAVPGNLVYADSATVSLNRDNQINPGKTISFSTTSGSQYLNLQGHNLIVAGIDLITSSDSRAAIQNQDTVDSLATLTVNNSGSYTYRGKIRDNNGASGRLALVKKGSGTLTIAGASSGGYTGGLRVENGTLDYSGGALPACDYTVTGGILNTGSLSQSIGTFQITGGTVTGAGTLTSSAAYDVQSGVVDVALAGSVGLNKTGSGTATLTKNNPLTGVTNITAGTLQLGNGSAGGGVAGNVTDNAALIYNRSDNFTYSGVLSGSGTLEKKGAGTMTLTSNNPFSGMTTVTAGTLQLGNGGISGSLAGNITNHATLIFNRSDNVTFAGTISGTGGILHQGSGLLTLTANNSFNGGTIIQEGTLQIGAGGALGSITGDVVNHGILAFNRSDNVSFAGAISGMGSLVQQGSGVLTLTAANSYSWGTTIQSGTLQIGAGGTTGSIIGNVSNYGTLVFNRSDNITFAGSISGTGSLVQQGDGILTLTGNSYFNGGTIIQEGTLQIGAGGASGSIAGNITDHSALIFNRADNFTYSGLLDGNGLLSKLGAGKLTLTGENSFTGSATISDGTLVLSGGGQLSSSILNNALFEISDGVASHSVGAISGAGTTQLNANARLTAPSVVQHTLTIGTGAKLTIAPLGAGAAGSGSQAVPEPGTLVFLAMAGLGILTAARRGKR